LHSVHAKVIFGRTSVALATAGCLPAASFRLDDVPA
jgi:hypothetical protein